MDQGTDEYFSLMFWIPIEFNSVWFWVRVRVYSPIVSRCFTEVETQSQNPPVSTGAENPLPLTGRNLQPDPADKEEPSC